MKALRILAVAAAALGAGPALAQDPGYGATGADIVIELGGGVAVQPRWEGSDDIIFSPWPIVSLKYLSLGPVTIGGGPKSAFSIRPDFALRGERDDNDDAALTGIGDVDMAVELGLAASYRYGPVEASLAVRHGFGGHDGFVGEASVVGIANPTPRWTIQAGPEVTFADDNYMETYFGVSATQSAASGLARHDAGASFKSAGIIAESRYDLTDSVALHAKASWHRLLGDAADSPIVKAAGSEDQFTAGVGLSYRFSLDLFD